MAKEVNQVSTDIFMTTWYLIYIFIRLFIFSGTRWYQKFCFIWFLRVVDREEKLIMFFSSREYYNTLTVYLPFCSVLRIVQLWKEDLAKVNKKAADSLADPSEYENLFPEFQEALQAEQVRLKTFLNFQMFLIRLLFFVNVCFLLAVENVQVSEKNVSVPIFFQFLKRERVQMKPAAQYKHVPVRLFAWCTDLLW